MTQNMVCKPENLVFTPSQGLEGSVLDSCEFRGFVPNFGLYIPLSGPSPGTYSGIRGQSRVPPGRLYAGSWSASCRKAIALVASGKTRSDPTCSSRAFDSTSRAATDSGTRCGRPPFIRSAGTVHNAWPVSISLQTAPRASPRGLAAADRSSVRSSGRCRSGIGGIGLSACFPSGG